MAAEAKWARQAAAENARRIAAAPLLAHAGLVPLTTAEERQARKERIHAETLEQFRARDELIERKIAEYLDQLGPHRAEVEPALARYPRGEYWVDALGRALRRIADGLPPLEEGQRYLTAEEADVGRVKVRATLALWAAVDAQFPEDAALAKSGSIAAVKRMSERRRAAEEACGG